MLKSVLNLRLPQSITGGAQEKGNLDTLQACCCKTQIVSLPWMPLAAWFSLTFHSSNTEKSGNKTFRSICRYITPYSFLYELSADLQRSLFLSKFCKRVLGGGRRPGAFIEHLSILFFFQWNCCVCWVLNFQCFGSSLVVRLIETDLLNSVTT